MEFALHVARSIDSVSLQQSKCLRRRNVRWRFESPLLVKQYRQCGVREGLPRMSYRRGADKRIARYGCCQCADSVQKVDRDAVEAEV